MYHSFLIHSSADGHLGCFLKKLQIELPYDPAIPPVGIHSKETRIERDTYTPMFIAASFTIAKPWKQMDKKAVVHIHNGILLSF